MSFVAADVKLKHLVTRIHQQATVAAVAHHQQQQRATTDQLVAEGIRNQLITRATLPLLLQRVVLYRPPSTSFSSSSSTTTSSCNNSDGGVAVGSWKIALQVLQAPSLDRFRIERHDSIWPLLRNLAPCSESRQAIEGTCKLLMGRTAMRTLGGQSPASQPSGDQTKRGKSPSSSHFRFHSKK